MSATVIAGRAKLLVRKTRVLSRSGSRYLIRRSLSGQSVALLTPSGRTTWSQTRPVLRSTGREERRRSFVFDFALRTKKPPRR